MIFPTPACPRCCIKEKPCGTATGAGGEGITITRHTMPNVQGYIGFQYEAYSVPDRFTVSDDQGNVLFDTFYAVSGRRSVDIFKPCGVKSVTVRVEGPPGTAWNYVIGCPCSGFPAFDGSNRRFRVLTVYDLDDCSPNGYYSIEKYNSDVLLFNCSRCKVIESTMTIVSAGQLIYPCPNFIAVDSPINSATKISVYKDPPVAEAEVPIKRCGNPDGSKRYVELSDEITCTSESESSGNPLP